MSYRCSGIKILKVLIEFAIRSLASLMKDLLLALLENLIRFAASIVSLGVRDEI